MSVPSGKIFCNTLSTGTLGTFILRFHGFLAKNSFLGHFWPNLGQKLGFWCLTGSQFPGWWLVQIWLCLLFYKPQVHIRGCIFHFFKKMCPRPIRALWKWSRMPKLGFLVPLAVHSSERGMILPLNNSSPPLSWDPTPSIKTLIPQQYTTFFGHHGDLVQ